MHSWECFIHSLVFLLPFFPFWYPRTFTYLFLYLFIYAILAVNLPFYSILFDLVCVHMYPLVCVVFLPVSVLSACIHVICFLVSLVVAFLS